MTDFRKLLEENRCPIHSDCGAFQMCMCSLVEDAADEIERLRGALEWYAEQARLCRLITSDGDPGRHRLADDGGKRARAALDGDGKE